MRKVVLLLLLLMSAVALGGIAYRRLRRANEQLRREVVAARTQREATLRQREQDRQLQQMDERLQIDPADARQELDASIAVARLEIANLEERAEARRESKLARDRAAADALASNRDLLKGPVLLENCADVGRATPVDALQTLIWAALKGDEEKLAQLVGVSGKARDLLAAVLTRLPESSRAKYPTPERLAGLFVTDLVTGTAAAHVVQQETPDARHTILTIAGLNEKTQDVPMELGPFGWQVSISNASAAKKITARLLGSPVPKK